MIVERFIEREHLPLQWTDKVGFALGSMDAAHLAHLPVLDGDIFLGLISEEQLHEVDDENIKLCDARILPLRYFVSKERSVFELLKMFHLGQLTAIPVLENNGLYAGYVSATKVVWKISEMVSANKPGGVIILELATEDYQLSEIAQILESNDLKVWSIITENKPDSTLLEVAVKLDKRDLSRAIQTFSRYEYTILSAEYEDVHDLKLNDRYDLLMRLLDI